MYKFNLFYIFLFLLGSLFPGCKNREKERENVGTSFKMVEVPAVITDEDEALVYIAEHFWDNMNFSDKRFLENKDDLNHNFYNFMDFINRVPLQTGKKSFLTFTEKLLAGDSLMIDHLRGTAEKALFDPNSPFRNEDIYIPFLEKLILSPKIDTTVREHLVYQLNLAKRNRPGERASDFGFTYRDKRQGTLYNLASEYILLAFLDPDCPACQTAIEEMKKSPVLRKTANRLKILTIYTGVEQSRWKDWSKILDPSWINGYDRKFSIQEGSLYDLRPTPSLYLLDRNKVVILKDAPLKKIEEYLNKNA